MQSTVLKFYLDDFKKKKKKKLRLFFALVDEEKDYYPGDQKIFFCSLNVSL